MNKTPLLSICIPVNGRLEYVINTIESIYSEIDLNDELIGEFEVVISDNGNEPILEILKSKYNVRFKNLYFHLSHCDGFMNSIRSLELAKGDLLLLHNSQELFLSGTLVSLLSIIKNYKESKPLMFFSNSFLYYGKSFEYNSFDKFIFKLSYWITWSNGFSIWKDDFDKVIDNHKLNQLFPHTSLLFSQFDKSTYVVNDIKYFKTQNVKNRGGHNKFNAFCVQFPSILNGAYLEKKISNTTRSKILNDILFRYLPLLYFNVIISKREYFSSIGFKNDMKLYFNNFSFYIVCVLSIFSPLIYLVRKIRLIILEINLIR
jgi:hypothetical protein